MASTRVSCVTSSVCLGSVCVVNTQYVSALQKKNGHNQESINRHNALCIKSRGSMTFSLEYQFMSKLFSALHPLQGFVTVDSRGPDAAFAFTSDRDEFDCCKAENNLKTLILGTSCILLPKVNNGRVVVVEKPLFRPRRLRYLLRFPPVFFHSKVKGPVCFPCCAFAYKAVEG